MTPAELSRPRIPVATYRLQFSYRFTFSDAARLIQYLDDLGVSDVYGSPCFAAGKKSTHGYDIVDPNRLSREMGGQTAFDRYVKKLQQYGMGLILDIVPNHMNVQSDKNLWWMDVLENGPSSVYADFFDIDWTPVKRELENRVLIPILGEPYGVILENQELRLAFEKGTFLLHHYDHVLPILPETYAMVLAHRIDEAQGAPDTNRPDFAELLSIITALTCLPPYTDQNQERVRQRHREKEIIKKRLHVLYKKSIAIKEFINRNILIFNGTQEDSRSFDLLDELLDKQVWRLSYWRVATEEINYRRFFDINGLAAIRMENPAVFKKTHALTLRLIREGKVTGLRVDHPDGLYDPSGYFRELQRNCYIEARRARMGLQNPGTLSDGASITEGLRKEYEEALRSDQSFKPFYIVGEKILMKGERMPEDWPIFGTVGYIFLNPLNGIFVEGSNSKTFDRIYTRFTGSRAKYQDIVYEKKRLIMLASMSAEINTLGQSLNRISQKNRHTKDFTLNSLRNAIMEVIACFPIYRTYTTASGVNKRYLPYVEQAVLEAKRRNPALSATAYDFLRRVLLLEYPEHINESDRAEWIDFVLRFQQTTGPVMAKGVEDTVFYAYNRLMSLNEVGGSPDRFGTTLDAFHRQNGEAVMQRPYSLLATSTHDTKRSEDARARLNVLSEIPDEWRRHLVRWGRLNRKKKFAVEGRIVPDRNEEYLLYQTLVAVWPLDGFGRGDYELFKSRIRNYMLKAVREAKTKSSWISPNKPYEEALLKFIDSILSRPAANLFLKDFTALQAFISYAGMFNSLSQTILKITSPGVPDFYQGCEVWDFSLVDPDSRRPVDFSKRRRMLRGIIKRIESSGQDRTQMTKGLLAQWQTGAIKLYLTLACLDYRKKNHALFENGGYMALNSKGLFAEHVCAFARKLQDKTALTVAPRFLTGILKRTSEPLGLEAWDNSCIILPDEIASNVFHNVLTKETIKAEIREGGRVLVLGEVFATFPAALLETVTA